MFSHTCLLGLLLKDMPHFFFFKKEQFLLFPSREHTAMEVEKFAVYQLRGGPRFLQKESEWKLGPCLRRKQ